MKQMSEVCVGHCCRIYCICSIFMSYKLILLTVFHQASFPPVFMKSGSQVYFERKSVGLVLDWGFISLASACEHRLTFRPCVSGSCFLPSLVSVTLHVPLYSCFNTSPTPSPLSRTRSLIFIYFCFSIIVDIQYYISLSVQHSG